MRLSAAVLGLTIVVACAVPAAAGERGLEAVQVSKEAAKLAQTKGFEEASRYLADAGGKLERKLVADRALLDALYRQALESQDLRLAKDVRAKLGALDKRKKRTLGRLEFTRAHLLQSEGQWRASADAYNAFLGRYPDQDQAVRNLALVIANAGRHREAEGYLLEVAGRHPRREDRYRLLAGDIASRAVEQARRRKLEQSEVLRRIRRAVEHYARAAELAPGREIQARLLGARKDLARFEGPRPLLAYAERLLYDGEREAALEGFAHVVRLGRDGARAEAERACVGWANASAALGRAGSADLARLPIRGWDNTCARELRALFTRNQISGSDVPWWTNRPERAHAAASLLRLRGNAALKAERTAEGLGLLGSAFAIAPDHQFYLREPFDRYEWIKLDIARDYARALQVAQRSGEVDELAEDFKHLLRVVFGDKGEAIREGNLRAVQKFHTTLALIYVEMEPPHWSTPGDPAGALFQLRRALEAAAMREVRLRFPHQPLPELRTYLALGQAATGDTKAALSTYIRAAQAWLDTDYVGRSRRTIRAAARLPDAAERPRARETLAFLERVAKVREALEGLDLRADPQAAARHREALETALAAGAQLALVPGFLDRQRFKGRMDLGAKLVEAGRPAEGAALMARGVGAEGERMSLTSYVDLHRLRTLERSLEPYVRFAGRQKPVATTDVLPNAKMASRLQFASGATRAAVAVQVSPDLLAAGRLLRHARVTGEDGRAAFVRFAIDGGTVTVREDDVSVAQRATFQGKATQVPGVTAVEFRRSLGPARGKARLPVDGKKPGPVRPGPVKPAPVEDAGGAQPQAARFALVAKTPARTVTAGNGTTFELSLRGAYQGTPQVATTLPAGVTVAFDGRQGKPTRILTVATSPETPRGTHLIMVAIRVGGTGHAVTLELTVR